MPVSLYNWGARPCLGDDETYFGRLDWNVGGRYHDALKLGYAKNAHQLHFILAFNQNKEKKQVANGTYYYDGAQPYKNMQTLWYHLCGANPNLDVSLLFMNLGWKPVMQKQKLPYPLFADVRYLRDLSAGIGKLATCAGCFLLSDRKEQECAECICLYGKREGYLCHRQAMECELGL